MYFAAKSKSDIEPIWTKAPADNMCIVQVDFRMGSFSADDVISFTVSNYDAGSYFSAYALNL